MCSVAGCARLPRPAKDVEGALAFEYDVNRIGCISSKDDLLDMCQYLAVWKKVRDDWNIADPGVSSDAPAPVPLNPSK